jgi:hypothetical protein
MFIEAAVKADQVFLPVLENASKAQKLRTTLGVFERSKFFFNLPSFVMDSIDDVRTILTKYSEAYIARFRDVMNKPCATTRRVRR